MSENSGFVKTLHTIFLLCREKSAILCYMFKKLFLLFFLLFFLGCGSTPPIVPLSQSQISTSTPTLPEKKFQFTGPWEPLLFESFYTSLYPVPKNIPAIKGGIVPHHLLAGAIDASFFQTISVQNPSVIVVIGPNHFGRGQGEIISTERNWKTPFGEVETNQDIVRILTKEKIVTINEDVMKEEHSTYTIIPFIRYSLKHSTVVPLIVQPNASTSTMDHLVDTLAKNLPPDAVVVGSIDFSHYKTLTLANQNDEKTIQAIHDFSYDTIPTLDVDSPQSIYAILKLMEIFDAKKIVHEIHSNSAIITHDVSAKETTSYYSPYFSQY